MIEPTFSFVILTFNSGRYIETCLKNINDSIIKLNLKSEVFVVDNGSVDKTRSVLKSFKFNDLIDFKTIFFETNTGTTFSRNSALKKTTGQYLIVLDSDAYVNSDALIHLKTYLDANKKCGLVVPKLIYPDGRYQLSVDQFPTLIHKIKRFLFLKKMEGKSIISQTTQVDYAISAFWMFPRGVLEKVGLLDEKIFYSPEDVDYCIRVWKSGYNITYIPKYQVIHDAQEISRGKGFKVLNIFSLSHIKGLFYLYFKHKFIFSGEKFIK